MSIAGCLLILKLAIAFWRLGYELVETAKYFVDLKLAAAAFVGLEASTVDCC